MEPTPDDATSSPETDASAGDAIPAGAPQLPNALTPQRPTNPLSRPTDAVNRPGFRAPSNKRSKAQKKRRKKKR
ncbi:MAG: hypothetical protein AAFV53_35310 [Myxococcota bacterium]